MKTFTKKAMMRVVLLFAIFWAFAGVINLMKSNEGAKALVTCDDCGTVTNQQIIEYMSEHGYTVNAIWQIQGSCDKKVDTQFCYHTRVFICGGMITGWEDDPHICE